MYQEGMMIIISMCGIVLLFIAIKAKSHIILNLLYRGLAGSLAITVMNYLFQFFDFPLQIGLNPITFLTCTFLGFPGFLALLGIVFYGSL